MSENRVSVLQSLIQSLYFFNEELKGNEEVVRVEIATFRWSRSRLYRDFWPSLKPWFALLHQLTVSVPDISRIVVTPGLLSPQKGRA